MADDAHALLMLAFFIIIISPIDSSVVHVTTKVSSNGMNDIHGKVSNARRKHALSIV